MPTYCVCPSAVSVSLSIDRFALAIALAQDSMHCTYGTLHLWGETDRWGWLLSIWAESRLASGSGWRGGAQAAADPPQWRRHAVPARTDRRALPCPCVRVCAQDTHLWKDTYIRCHPKRAAAGAGDAAPAPNNGRSLSR